MEAFMVASIPGLLLVGFSCLFRAIFVGFCARLVPSILWCLGSDLLVGIMDSCFVHLCA
jgi:hypothetical protein